MTVSSIDGFLEARGLGENSLEEASKTTRERTTCRAWLVGDDMGIIVVVNRPRRRPIELNYPFHINKFWLLLDRLEDETLTNAE